MSFQRPPFIVEDKNHQVRRVTQPPSRGAADRYRSVRVILYLGIVQRIQEHFELRIRRYRDGIIPTNAILPNWNPKFELPRVSSGLF